jgi:glutamine amidotransferase
MCRLFGLYANKLVNVYFSFFEARKSLKEQSHRNPHGWGIAWFDGFKWDLYKEPQPLYKSSKAKELIKEVSGIIIISHVRYATYGEPKTGNTHPWLYKGYVFAHNGSIIDREKLLSLLSQNYKDLEGDTDSEVFFHLIIQETKNSGGSFIEGVRRAIAKINNNSISYSSLNFVASDGRKLYALRYARKNLDYYTLYYLKRPREDLKIEKVSEKTAQLIKMKLEVGEKAVVVASEKLTEEEEKWDEIPNKHMLIVNEDLNTELVKI